MNLSIVCHVNLRNNQLDLFIIVNLSLMLHLIWFILMYGALLLYLLLWGDLVTLSFSFTIFIDTLGFIS